MKNNLSKIILLILSFSVLSCAGYKPIFSSSNVSFEIIDYEIEGNEDLANKIYLKLENLSKQQSEKENNKRILISIKVDKDKNPTTKNSAGKILEYKILLNTHVIVRDYNENKVLIDQEFSSSFSYKVRDQYFETVKLENKSTENLIEKTYQDILIKLSENI